MSASPGPVALVTGCSTGIGRATAFLLARSGYRVFATVRTPEAEASLRTDAAGLSLEILRKDFLEEDAASTLVQEVLGRAGRMDVLVNNAGYALLGAVEDLRAEAVRRQFQVNVFAPVQLSRAVLPTMRAQRYGRIVNVSSMAGRVSVPLMGAYCASKFAREAFSDSLRAEAKPFGVRVSLVEPGPVATEFNRTAVAASREILEARSPYRAVYQDYLDDFSTLGAATPQQAARTILKAIRAARPRSRYRVRAREALLAGIVQLVPKGAMDFATIRFMGLQKLGRS
ncbi:MAG: SDR family oxidoreductase [Candidatus Thermoplasmatota archaeon]